MSDPAVERGRHAWERWLFLWHGLFYAVLALSTLSALTRSSLSARGRIGAVSLSVAFALLYRFVVAGHPEWFVGRTAVPVVLYVLAAGTLFGVLVAIDDVYVTLLYALYPQMFLLLSVPWGVASCVGLTAVLFGAAGGWSAVSENPADVISSFAGPILLGIVITVFIQAIANESLRRQEAIDALEATRAELAATSRVAGMLEERQRLAREIHDTVAQGLAGVVTQLEAAEQSLSDADGARGVDEARAHLDRARDMARAGLGEVRRSVHALRPAELEEAPFPDAVARVVAGWAEPTGVSARHVITGTSCPLPPDVEATMLRVLQEALANVARHAAARRVWVTVSYMGDVVTMDVRDDGSGFDPEAVAERADGFGLTSMRQRIERAGGTLVLESSPGEGTTVSATVPMGLPTASRGT